MWSQIDPFQMPINVERRKEEHDSKLSGKSLILRRLIFFFWQDTQKVNFLTIAVLDEKIIGCIKAGSFQYYKARASNMEDIRKTSIYLRIYDNNTGKSKATNQDGPSLKKEVETYSWWTTHSKQQEDSYTRLPAHWALEEAL